MIDLTGIDPIEKVKRYLDDYLANIDEIPDLPWLHEESLVAHVHGDERKLMLDPGIYRIFMRNTNPIGATHPLIHWGLNHQRMNKVELRNRGRSRNFSKRFEIEIESELVLRFKCEGFATGALPIGTVHVFFGIAASE